MYTIRRFLCAAMFAASCINGAHAQSSPVVVELFTSQGCASCPSADELLAELGSRDDVLPLSLHVDYWDYIGWKDKFASPAFTHRQKAYASAAGRNMVYTPQMIMNGGEHVVGNKTMKVMMAIERAKEKPSTVEISVVEGEDAATVSINAVSGSAGKSTVELVRYIPSEVVQISLGENAGRNLTYTNVVTSWQVLKEWNGRGSLQIKVPRGTRPGAVIVQGAGYDEILAAARLR